jgi:hypothetical protein
VTIDAVKRVNSVLPEVVDVESSTFLVCGDAVFKPYANIKENISISVSETIINDVFIFVYS